METYIHYMVTEIDYELEPAPQPPTDIPEPLPYYYDPALIIPPNILESNTYISEPAPRLSTDILEPFQYERLSMLELQKISDTQNYLII